MISKLQPLSKMTLAFLMALFSVWTWGQTTYTFTSKDWAATPTNWTAGSSGNLLQSGRGIQITSSTSGAYGNSPSFSNVSKVEVIYSTNASSGAGSIRVNSVSSASATANSGTQIGSTFTITAPSSGGTTDKTATFTPASAVTGNVQVYVACTSNSIYIKSVTITTASSIIPTVTASSFTGTIGTAFSQSIQATENPTSYAVANGSSLPGGLSLNTTSGLISGTPTTVGSFTTDITATNGAGTSAPATFNFTIAKGDQTLTGFTDTGVNLSSGSSVILPSQTDQGLAVVYSSSNPVIASLSGNILTFSSPGSVLVTANQAGNSNYNALNLTKTFIASNSCFGEDFSSITTGNNTSTSGSSTAWGGNSNFPTLSSAYSAGGAVRLGSGSSSGSITSKVLSNIAGTITVSFAVKGWSSVEGDINVTVGSQTQTVTYSNIISSGSFENKSVIFSNVPIGSTLNIATTSGRAFIDNVSISCGDSTVWNGTAWSSNAPTSTTDAIINGTYSTTSNPPITAKNITVKSGAVLEVTSGNTVSAVDVKIEDGGNLIQRDGSTLTNTGAFNVLKNTTSAANKYVFWASPTASQNMYGIHTSTPQYVMTYNSDTDYYTTLSNPATSTPGVGYSVKMPVANAAATFGGATAQPNNGNVAVNLNNTSTNKYNLIGNPYPSNLDLNAFYNANSSSVNSTFWFWDNTSNNVTTQTGNTTTNVGYATYNAAGSGTWTEAPSSLASHSGSSAAVGQGFIVEATGTTATFTNAMRVSTTGNTFNKLNGNDTGKFWLKLATPYGSHTTLAVNYESGAQNTFDKFDSRAMGMGSDAFYSIVGAEKLVIQGKSPFTIDDVVPLGNKHFEGGNFVISLTQKEGIFNNGQAIYLHDKELGTYTNLQNGNYSFSANAGEFTNRFEIVYKLGALATQEIEKTTFEVYRDGEDFVARNSKNIERIEIFDASGRKIVELKPNTSSAKFKLEIKGMYILKALSAGKEYTQKLIK
ncbi:beta strand repeat-containing protein [Chryseobacterium geocarposphaerae]|uniref:Putative secreted protein (Por secretion system target) n=1 Tax=Chryseobacterium geocarposphaerae TaxID=1416776 RepID=A0A2M9CAK3_9FLAO|nr:Ig domain-containing protein [Chryseobacterium geocarposphaerae]PJJ67841.1 putative secreted protein (Por secretion system target) [Chryseobacterium geocarposphaerae]